MHDKCCRCYVAKVKRQEAREDKDELPELATDSEPELEDQQPEEDDSDRDSDDSDDALPSWLDGFEARGEILAPGRQRPRAEQVHLPSASKGEPNLTPAGVQRGVGQGLDPGVRRSSTQGEPIRKGAHKKLQEQGQEAEARGVVPSAG